MNGENALVLLVEDNPDHAELVMRTLEDHHILNRIRHLSDGKAALDYLLRQDAFADPASSPRPQMILLDLRLPKVDGIEVLKVIKTTEELKGIPVVILSTSDAQGDVERAYQNHANSYLVKPVGFEEFQKLMIDLGLYWMGWNIHQ